MLEGRSPYILANFSSNFRITLRLLLISEDAALSVLWVLILVSAFECLVAGLWVIVLNPLPVLYSSMITPDRVVWVSKNFITVFLFWCLLDYELSIQGYEEKARKLSKIFSA